MKLFSLFRQYFAVFLLIVVVSPVEARDMNQAAPASWTISGDKGTVHIFGSIHMLKPGTDWFKGTIKDMTERADQLVLEVRMTPETAAEMQPLVMELGLYPQGERLRDHVDAALFDQTAAKMKELRLPEGLLDRLRPWYASVVLASGLVQKFGFDPAMGVEPVIESRAIARGIPIIGLETPEQQLKSLSGGSQEAQVAMLRDTLRQLDEAESLLADLTQAWIRGDLQALDNLLLESMKTSPELYQAVLVDRNRTWVPQIKALLQTPGNHLVVVGIAHLLGPDSVLLMLEMEGVKAVRR